MAPRRSFALSISVSACTLMLATTAIVAGQSTLQRDSANSAEAAKPVDIHRLLGPEGAGPAIGSAFSLSEWESISVWLALSEDQGAEWNRRYQPVIEAWNRRANAEVEELRDGSGVMLDFYSAAFVEEETLDVIRRYHRTLWSLADAYMVDLEAAVLGAADFLDESQQTRLPDVFALAQRAHRLRWMTRPIPGARDDIEWAITDRLASCDKVGLGSIHDIGSSLEHYRSISNVLIRRSEESSRNGSLEQLAMVAALKNARSAPSVSEQELKRLSDELLESIARPRRAQIPFRQLCTGTITQVAGFSELDCLKTLLTWWDEQAFHPVAPVRINDSPELRQSLRRLCAELDMEDVLVAHLAECERITAALEARYEDWISESHVTGTRERDAIREYQIDMRALRDSLWRQRHELLTAIAADAARESEELPEVFAIHHALVADRWAEFANEPPDVFPDWPKHTR